jgi:hypothetical protein
MIGVPDSEQPIAWAEPQPGPDWHPEIKSIFQYWRSIQPATGLAGRQHLDPADIKRLLPGVWLLDVQHEPFRLRYRLVGTRVGYVIGREVTGLWLDEAHPDAAEKPSYFDRYRTVAETAVPSWRRGRPRLWVHQDFAIIENLLMPLAADGQQVNMLLAFTVLHDRRRAV